MVAAKEEILPGPRSQYLPSDRLPTCPAHPLSCLLTIPRPHDSGAHIFLFLRLQDSEARLS